MSIVLYVCRLRRSLYRNIITCGTSLVDQWLRICLCSSTGKESVCNVGDLGLIPGWEDPLEKGTATYSSILAWRIRGLYSPWGRKESDTTERLTFTQVCGRSVRGGGGGYRAQGPASQRFCHCWHFLAFIPNCTRSPGKAGRGWFFGNSRVPKWLLVD